LVLLRQSWLVTDPAACAEVATGTPAPMQIDTMIASPASRRTRVAVNLFMAPAAFL
jgi:hypothetical protein